MIPDHGGLRIVQRADGGWYHLVSSAACLYTRQWPRGLAPIRNIFARHDLGGLHHLCLLYVATSSEGAHPSYVGRTIWRTDETNQESHRIRLERPLAGWPVSHRQERMSRAIEVGEYIYL
jgi:hypothetical protein